MELKNQILLVILIPIILILLLAVLQVGLLGFVSIPSFQNSLLEFHINRHLNGLSIEMNIIQQEIYIQYQAYFNQLFGVTAHLRHYCFGEFQNYSSWTLDNMTLPPYSFTSGENTSENYKVAWNYNSYQKLSSLQNNETLSFLLNKITQSLTISDIIINNTRSLSQDLNITTSSETDNSTDETSSLIPINYASMLVHCSDSLAVRYPQFNSTQQQLLNGFNISNWLPKETFTLDSTLNFTMIYNSDDQFTQNYSLQITQIVSEDENRKCYLTAKILNDYLVDLTERHLQQHDEQGEKEHQLFTAFINSDYTTLTPYNYRNLKISQAIAQYIMDSKQLSLNSYNQLLNQISPYILTQIEQLLDDTETNSTQLIYPYGDYKFYILFSKIVLASTKKVSIVTAPENGKRYVYIEADENDFQMNTFILVHYFEETILIEELYEGTSLNNVRILEIIVLIVIIVLSVVIFLFVWYTATRIGLSFEQPIKKLTDYMNSIDIQNMDQEEELINYQDYFNSFEIKSLFQTMNIFVTTIKYSNQKYSNSKHSDAIALMELSKAKDFYKNEIGNMSAVGICANNIGILHMKEGRKFEAVNEMEEAIYIAKLELIEIKELKKWCADMQNALQEPGLYQNFKIKLKSLALKFKQQVRLNWISMQIKQDDQKREGTQTKQHTQSLVNKSLSQHRRQSVAQRSKSTMPHIAQLGTNTGTGTTAIINDRRTTQQISLIGNTVSIQTPVQKRKSGKSNFDGSNLLQPISQADNENSPYYSPQLSPNLSNQRQKYFGHSYNQSSIISQRVDWKESIMQQDEKQDDKIQEQRDRDNSGQSAISEIEMIKEKLLELDKKKQLARAKLQNRQFQLAQFMFNICMQYSEFMPETLKLFTDFEATEEKKQKLTQSNTVRLINLHVKKALLYIQIGDIGNFKVSEQKAEEYYNKLSENQYMEEEDEEQDFNFVDMFKNVPKEVLQSKILQLKAIYQLLQGNFKTATELLISIIELGEYYDPEVRDFCLYLMENIFNYFKISTLPIQQFRNQISINIYEIIFMIDYSKEMNLEQLNLSHSICTRIFSILQPQDLIGMYGFNNSLHESFPLQPKGTYNDLLTKQLYMAITAKGGNSKLFSALRYAVKNFFEHKIQVSDTGYLEKQKNSLQNKTKYLPEVIEEDENKSMINEIDNDNQKERENEVSCKMEKLPSDTDSDYEEDENYQFIRNGMNQMPQKNDQQHNFRSRYKYICIFTEINQNMTEHQQQKLSNLLERNQVDLMVFNIANQNANMLELKKLSKITPRSIFVNATANLEQLFGKSRQNQLQKKMYLEFF